jgi:hypothetical protein
MTESQLKATIERKRGNTSYSIWTIGVTDDPERRKEEHNNPRFWSHWPADSEAVARRVEKHFLDKGMKGAPGGGGSADYVYVF